eukprot:m.51084 g.51084  ORF g.51084 m.51084 type:complete len:50 (+) comp10709_c0_seq2:1404-1553(+)
MSWAFSVYGLLFKCVDLPGVFSDAARMITDHQPQIVEVQIVNPPQQKFS